jgi:polar amino acid transport system substrate-binding protein
VASCSKFALPAVEIVKELAKRTETPLAEMNTGVPRMAKLNETESAVFTLFVRSPDRENTYRWVGKLTDDHYCFATIKPNKSISSVEEAKSVKAIGVNKTGAAQTLAKQLGLTNFEEAVSNSGSARKLIAGRIDGWLVAERAATYVLKAEGVSPGKVSCSGNLAQTSFWVGASKKMSEGQFTKLQKAFADLEKEGFVKAALSKSL